MISYEVWGCDEHAGLAEEAPCPDCVARQLRHALKRCERDRERYKLALHQLYVTSPAPVEARFDTDVARQEYEQALDDAYGLVMYRPVRTGAPSADETAPGSE